MINPSDQDESMYIIIIFIQITRCHDYYPPIGYCYNFIIVPFFESHSKSDPPLGGVIEIIQPNNVHKLHYTARTLYVYIVDGVFTIRYCSVQRCARGRYAGAVALCYYNNIKQSTNSFGRKVYIILCTLLYYYYYTYIYICRLRGNICIHRCSRER